MAEEDDGPRSEPGMPPAECNSYSNLILLCRDDHTLADKDHGIHYSVEQLHEMQADHEAMVDRRLSEVESESETRSRKRQETLLEAASARRGRLVAQWLAAGADAELAQALAHDEAVGAPARLGQALPSTGLLVLEGDFGSGKSVTAERIYAADNATTMENDSAPLPLWLAARATSGWDFLMAVDTRARASAPVAAAAAITAVSVTTRAASRATADCDPRASIGLSPTRGS